MPLPACPPVSLQPPLTSSPVPPRAAPCAGSEQLPAHEQYGLEPIIAGENT